MIILEQILAFKELGTAAVFLITFYIFAEAYRKDFFKQLDQANLRGEESQKIFIEYLNRNTDTLIKNTEHLAILATNLNNHTKTKEEALSLLQEKDKTINELFNMIKDLLREGR